MIHVVGSHNAKDYKNHLSTLWQQRYSIFVEKMGWNLNCQEGIERDQFDHEETVYLLNIDNQNRLKGAMRLLPTDQKHLMTETFSHLCNDGVPRGEGIWEVSRLYSLTARHMLLERDRTVSELVCGLYEYALISGIKQFTCVASMVLFPTILKAGWNVTPLGLPDVVDGEVVLAFLVDLTEQHYPAVKFARGVTQSVLYMPSVRAEVPLDMVG